MIITEKKPLQELLQKLGGLDNIFIFGCGTCATKCATGGEPEVLELAAELQKSGRKVSGWNVIESPCDRRLAVKALREIESKIKESRAALVLSCGSGVQNLAGLLKLPVIPGLNTLFLGKIENLRSFEEGCGFCGNCSLDETGGICIMTGCPKKQINGPCGGSEEGKCEVDNTRDCVWKTISEKVKTEKLPALFEIKKPRHPGQDVSPRKIKK